MKGRLGMQLAPWSRASELVEVGASMRDLVGHVEREVALLLEQQHADPLGPQLADQLGDERDDRRREALGRLVEDQDVRPQQHRAGDREHLLLAAAQRAGADLGAPGEVGEALEQPLAGLTPAAIARGGIVQCPETRELFGDMTVRENLELGGHRLEPTALAERLDWLFDLFPILRERTGQVARTLSGGEQQMLAIARALMMEPRLLILDEPTLGLAPVILETLSNALHRLRGSTRLTVLLGEQNVTFALPHADRLYVIDHGRLAWEGEPDRFETEAADAYL